MGRFIDSLAVQTLVGLWLLFLTITYRTANFPWCRGFPNAGSGRPKSEFARHLFERLLMNLEQQLGSCVDYVVADQFRDLHGRLHQHAILSAPGLAEYPRKEIWEWLKQHAGWSRVLPFEHGAAFYISRYIGRDMDRCEWNLRIGERQRCDLDVSAISGVVIAKSAEMPKAFFHNSFSRRKR